MWDHYVDVENEINLIVQKEFLERDFFQTLKAGQYTMKQLRHFAIQYSYYSRHFPRILGAAISAMAPIDSWWVPLADNLWDEAGRGAVGHSHEQLYKTFLKSVDPNIQLNDWGMPPEPMGNAVQTAIETFLQFFHQATPLAAMSAVGLGSEMFAGRIMGEIASGLSHPNYQKKQSLELLFWHCHADEHEPRHYQLCKNVLIQYSKPEELAIQWEAGSYIARSEATMYQSLHEEMLLLDA